MTAPVPVLVYDDECGFCARSVQRVLRHDRTGTLQFAARSGAWGGALLQRHPHLIDVDSVLWVDPRTDGTEEIFSRFDAVLRTAGYLGGAWRLLDLTRIIPGALRDAGYRFVARHRHRLTRSHAVCVVPTPAQRARFLD